MPNETLAPPNTILNSKTLGKTLQNHEHRVRPFLNHLRAVGVWTKGGTTDRPPVTRAGQVAGQRSWDWAGEEAASATVVSGLFLIFSAISSHFRPTHSFLPPFLGPLNSFPWSLFADSSSFESYDENNVGRRLD